MLTVLKYKWPLWVLPMPLLFVWTWNGPFIYVCPCGTQTQQFKTITNKSKIQTKYSEMQKKHIHSTLVLYLLVFYLFIYTIRPFKGVLHPWALFLKTLCIFSKNKATSDKVSYGSGQKCSKELKNHSFTSVETIVVKLQWKMCENQYFSCFEP